MNELIKLFYGDTFSKLTDAFENEFLNYFSSRKQLFANATSFTEVDGHYEMTLDVKDGANNDDIKIDLENGVLTVSYTESTENSERFVKVSENMPEDADDSTLDATVDGGKLTITVEKKSVKKEIKPHVHA